MWRDFSSTRVRIMHLQPVNRRITVRLNYTFALKTFIMPSNVVDHISTAPRRHGERSNLLINDKVTRFKAAAAVGLKAAFELDPVHTAVQASCRTRADPVTLEQDASRYTPVKETVWKPRPAHDELKKNKHSRRRHTTKFTNPRGFRHIRIKSHGL